MALTFFLKYVGTLFMVIFPIYIDAPPNSLKDLDVSPKVKTIEKRVGYVI
jgi:hypothetical protein